MIAICEGIDLSSYVGQGYTIEFEPQYGRQITTMDGIDHSAKIRDRVKITVPFIPLTLTQLTQILKLFSVSDAYVQWTYYDPYLGSNATIEAKYDTRSSVLKCVKKNGTEYYSGLVVKLIER